MPEPNKNLDQVQRWMQAVISHPLGIAVGIGSQQAQQQLDIDAESIENVIDPSASLSSIERLAIYGNAYYARLLECLRVCYPILCHALGKELFDQFSLRYLQTYPSRSYTLEHLGSDYAQYLEETRPPHDGDAKTVDDKSQANADWPELLVDVARLEWAIGKVFNAVGVEGMKLLAAEDLAAIAPDRWAEAQLVPVVCLQLLEFRFDLNDYYTKMRNSEASDGPQPEIPSPQTTYLALSRRDYIVRRYSLTHPEYVILKALQSGETIGNAIALGADQSDLTDEQLADRLHGWFSAWTRERFFQAVRFPEEASE